MAKLRRAKAYRKFERPYTRKSKFKKKSFVKATPVCKIVRFDMGSDMKKFTHYLVLISKSELQIRHNALESARQTTLRVLEKNLGKNGFKFKVRVYPHHVLRENAMASGAGADRLSMGMQLAFGKPIGIAARVKEGQVLFSLGIDEPNLELGKKALHRAATKLPCSCLIQITKKN